MATEQSIAKRFWPKVQIGDPKDCWLWIGGRNPDGYGRLNPAHGIGKGPMAHRVSWELAHGAIPSGLLVLHRCDNPPCVNPAHLWLGTIADNNADCIAKGRHAHGPTHGSVLHPERLRRGANHPARLNPGYLKRGDDHPARRHPECLKRGEEHPNAKLTERDVRGIRIALASGLSQKSVASLFGMSRYAIVSIQHGKTWRHVKD